MKRKFKKIKQGLQNTIITNHAKYRMASRNISEEAIKAAVDFGRTVYTRGAEVYIIGKKEIKAFKKRIDLRAFEGVTVVFGIKEQMVITAYKNKNLKQALRVA